MIKKFLVVAIFATTFLNSNEISVFDAGNLNSDSPYGLTENEQVLLKNRQKVADVATGLNNTNESLEGLKTVLEGTNSQIANLENRVADLEIRATGKVSKNSDIEAMKKDIAWLKSQINEINKKLGTTPVKKNNEISENSANSGNSANFENKNSAEILKEAENFYAKKDYTNAKERFEYLTNKNYKPAKSNFMLGEIAYFGKSYSEAIKYYQKSISLNDEADYTPKLLYHTAISFDKIGDKDSATQFYNALKTGYPDSNEAKASPNRK